jgi:hypothetical protein
MTRLIMALRSQNSELMKDILFHLDYYPNFLFFF